MAQTAPAIRDLTDVQRAVLEFERLRWKYIGAKETEILTRFGMTSVRYFQVLNKLLDHPAAEAYDTELVRRLRRLRDARVRARRR